MDAQREMVDKEATLPKRGQQTEFQAYLEALAYGEMLEDELESLEGGYRKWTGELERGEEQDITMELGIHTFVAEYPEQRQDLESQMKKQKVLIAQSRAKCVAAGYDPISAEQEYSVGRAHEPYANYQPVPAWDVSSDPAMQVEHEWHTGLLFGEWIPPAKNDLSTRVEEWIAETELSRSEGELLSMAPGFQRSRSTFANRSEGRSCSVKRLKHSPRSVDSLREGRWLDHW
ncbi:hypothetical protein LTR56_011213 [Elasticomyces elasticus]|nr:hypothetical protein LTR56_011213 [Elasticomyces elasticus]KAK4921844.1 hypothetical protein LTR49_010783 [Elasticomyces elasticus]KAK5751430.1 hypothetical protein LTS12_018518 [Elasticomyces elasticus]